MPVRNPLPDRVNEAIFWNNNAWRLNDQSVKCRAFFDASLAYAWRIYTMTNAEYKIERDKILRLNNG